MIPASIDQIEARAVRAAAQKRYLAALRTCLNILSANPAPSHLREDDITIRAIMLDVIEKEAP